MFGANHLDPAEVEKAKKVLKVRKSNIAMFNDIFLCSHWSKNVNLQEHEQALADAIAKLADISDGESGMNLMSLIVLCFFRSNKFHKIV